MWAMHPSINKKEMTETYKTKESVSASCRLHILNANSQGKISKLGLLNFSRYTKAKLKIIFNL